MERGSDFRRDSGGESGGRAICFATFGGFVLTVPAVSDWMLFANDAGAESSLDAFEISGVLAALCDLLGADVGK